MVVVQIFDWAKTLSKTFEVVVSQELLVEVVPTCSVSNLIVSFVAVVSEDSGSLFVFVEEFR